MSPIASKSQEDTEKVRSDGHVSKQAQLNPITKDSEGMSSTSHAPT